MHDGAAGRCREQGSVLVQAVLGTFVREPHGRTSILSSVLIYFDYGWIYDIYTAMFIQPALITVIRGVSDPRRSNQPYGNEYLLHNSEIPIGSLHLQHERENPCHQSLHDCPGARGRKCVHSVVRSLRTILYPITPCSVHSENEGLALGAGLSLIRNIIWIDDRSEPPVRGKVEHARCTRRR